jgi:hypothetical protein
MMLVMMMLTPILKVWMKRLMLKLVINADALWRDCDNASLGLDNITDCHITERRCIEAKFYAEKTT